MTTTQTTAQQLDPEQREALFGLWLDSQRYQQGVLDNKDLSDSQQWEADLRQWFDRWLADPVKMCIVTLQDNVPVAYIRASLHADPGKRGAYIDDLFVAQAQRQQGLAWQLIDEAKRWAFERRASVLKLSVARQNTSAIALYEAAGFHEVPPGYLDYELPLN